MNKKDIAHIRRQFKSHNDQLTISDIFQVYIRKESSEIYHEESQPFPMLEEEKQELLFNNFKKVLTGRLDVKLFDVKFQTDGEELTQHILHEGLTTDDVEQWKEEMRLIVEKMFADLHYEFDIVLTFIRGKYAAPRKRNSSESEVSDWDEVYALPFILCTMNKTEQPKNTLTFDYVEKEFKSNVVVDPVVNLASPIGGFLYPTFTEQGADVNYVLYAAGKANQPDLHFIEHVLNGEDVTTALEDKAIFEEIVKEVVGEEVATRTLANVYEEINRLIDEEEEAEEEAPTLDYRDVGQLLTVSGVADVDVEKVEHAFKTVLNDESHELKATSIMPNYTSKSIKINTKVANISISPQDLKYVKQVHVDGKRCLLIEVDEDMMIDGFRLIPEANL